MSDETTAVPTTVAGWLGYINQASVAVVLAAVLVAGWMGYWVFGATYQAAIRDRDEWKAIALKAVNLADVPSPRVVGMTPEQVEAVRRQSAVSALKGLVESKTKETVGGDH